MEGVPGSYHIIIDNNHVFLQLLFEIIYTCDILGYAVSNARLFYVLTVSDHTIYKH